MNFFARLPTKNNVFRIQGGRYAAAEMLLEELRDLEQKQLGDRPDKMVELYWLSGHIMDEVVRHSIYT